MFRAVIGALLVIAVLIAGCGSNSSTESTGGSETTTEPASVKPEPESTAERSERLAKEYIKESPGAIAGICKLYRQEPAMVERQFGSGVLGTQILEEGASISETLEAIERSC